MILDMILNVLSGLLNILLSPLQVINISIDFVTSINGVIDFIRVIAYLLPWNALLPLFAVVFIILNFKTIISIIMAVWKLLPFV